MRPTWFSTWPFSQPDAGVQATGSTRWCEHICRRRRLLSSLLADEDCLHGGLHIVVDAARARALEEREAALMRVEHHFLGLARIGTHEHHPAVAEADMRDFQSRRRAVHHHDLVAPR